jgi:hypothetical protein
MLVFKKSSFLLLYLIILTKNKINLFFTRVVGVSTADKDSLRFIYERDANFSAIPTYGVLMGQEVVTQTNLFTGATPGWENIDLSKVIVASLSFLKLKLNLFTVHSFYTSFCMASNLLSFTNQSPLAEI